MNKMPRVWEHEGEQAKAPLQYKGCGLDDIWLTSGYDIEEVDGEQSLTIRNLDGLLEAIAQWLVMKRKVLNGKEIRFLRQQLDLTQSELARLVGCDSQQIARYEKSENKMPGPSGRLLRMLVREHYQGEVPVRKILEALEDMDAQMTDRQVFDTTPDGEWRTAS